MNKVLRDFTINVLLVPLKQKQIFLRQTHPKQSCLSKNNGIKQKTD